MIKKLNMFLYLVDIHKLGAKNRTQLVSIARKISLIE